MNNKKLSRMELMNAGTDYCLSLYFEDDDGKATVMWVPKKASRIDIAAELHKLADRLSR